MLNRLLLFSALLALESLFGATVVYEAGIKGSSVQGSVLFDTPEGLSPEGGSIECFVKAKGSFLTEEYRGMLFSCGRNAAGWFYAQIDKGSLRFCFRNDQNHSSSVEAPISELAKDGWHHVVVTWGKVKQKEYARIYFDGKLAAHEKVKLPTSFQKGKIGVSCNTANQNDSGFSGFVDEWVLYDVPLAPETIAAHWKDPALVKPGEGVLLYAGLDGEISVQGGSFTPTEKKKELVRLSSRKIKVLKYADELEYDYHWEGPVPNDTVPGILNDGSEASCLDWRKKETVMTCELESSRLVEKIEITVFKHNKNYTLKEIQASFDDGNGEFIDSVIVKCFGKKAQDGDPIRDDSCHKYVYEIPCGKVVTRIRFRFSSLSYVCVSEVRLREK